MFRSPSSASEKRMAILGVWELFTRVIIPQFHLSQNGNFLAANGGSIEIAVMIE
jgi:hypothetical protein